MDNLILMVRMLLSFDCLKKLNNQFLKVLLRSELSYNKNVATFRFMWDDYSFFTDTIHHRNKGIRKLSPLKRFKRKINF